MRQSLLPNLSQELYSEMKNTTESFSTGLYLVTKTYERDKNREILGKVHNTPPTHFLKLLNKQIKTFASNSKQVGMPETTNL